MAWSLNRVNSYPLTILSWNAGGLATKITELKNFT